MAWGPGQTPARDMVAIKIILTILGSGFGSSIKKIPFSCFLKKTSVEKDSSLSSREVYPGPVLGLSQIPIPFCLPLIIP